jgi:endonuclease III
MRSLPAGVCRVRPLTPRRPRFVNDAPKTVRDLTRIVVEDCDGDASRIWIGKRASEVKRTFDSVYGVGPWIANMAVLLLERASRMRFDDQDHLTMGIKPDTHTRRVLLRLGASDSQTDEAAIAAARSLNPRYPGELDAPLWRIGRGWCSAYDPDCPGCPVGRVCARRL